MSLAGAADTAALQHSRLPLAYPSRRLGGSQSLPVIRGLPSKLLAPPTAIPLQTVPPVHQNPALAPAPTLTLRRAPPVTRPPSSALRHPLRDRVAHTSRLSEALRNDCLAKLDSISEQVWNASRPDFWSSAALHSEDESNASYDYLSIGDDIEDEAGSTTRASSKEQPASAKEQSRAPSAGAKDSALKVGVRTEMTALQLSGGLQLSGESSAEVAREAVPIVRGDEQPLQRAPNPIVNNLPAKLSCDPPKGGRSAVRTMAEESLLQNHRKLQKRGRSCTSLADTSSSSWRCSDSSVRPGMSRVTGMRATWSCRRAVDWDIGWLEPVRPPSRSRSASPDGDRDQPMTLPPMLLSSSEARRVASASRKAPARSLAAPGVEYAKPPEAARSTSEWRLRSLFENSMKYQVRI